MLALWSSDNMDNVGTISQRSIFMRTLVLNQSIHVRSDDDDDNSREMREIDETSIDI